jgi:putative spermidine/putrescine transport system permease protein
LSPAIPRAGGRLWCEYRADVDPSVPKREEEGSMESARPAPLPLPLSGLTTGERLERRQRRVQLALALPAVLVLAVFLFYPVARLLLRSFFDPTFSLDAYARIIRVPQYLNVLLYTMRTSVTVTLLCLLLGYPLAYALAKARGTARSAMLIFLLLPFWTSIMARTYAWLVILGEKGVINTWLLNWGIISTPLPLAFNSFAVHVGMVHYLLPFIVLPMFSIMLRIDRTLIRAGQSLGAGPWTVFWRVYFPLSLPGVLAGSLLVFILATGFFVTPSRLGGRTDVMLAQLIQQQIQTIGDWGFGSALSVVLLVAVALALAIYSRFGRLSTLWGVD